MWCQPGTNPNMGKPLIDSSYMFFNSSAEREIVHIDQKPTFWLDKIRAEIFTKKITQEIVDLNTSDSITMVHHSWSLCCTQQGAALTILHPTVCCIHRHHAAPSYHVYHHCVAPCCTITPCTSSLCCSILHHHTMFIITVLHHHTMSHYATPSHHVHHHCVAPSHHVHHYCVALIIIMLSQISVLHLTTLCYPKFQCCTWQRYAVPNSRLSFEALI